MSAEAILQVMSGIPQDSQRKWASSGSSVYSNRRTKSALPRNEKINFSVSNFASPHGSSRPSSGITPLRSDSTNQWSSYRPASGRPSSSRPTSARTRPLSGRVYLQKTVKKGWVARSSTDLEEDLDFDEYDDDWDDDFEGEGSEIALDGLLKSKQIMDSKRSQKKDWISGDNAIPKFHCPRCRDHWYGLTPYPCDDELARLIREGLWYTGMGPVDRDLIYGKNSYHTPLTKNHDLRSGKSDTDLTLPPILSTNGSNSSLDGTTRDRYPDGSNAKKGKRISFNLQHTEFVYDKFGSDEECNCSEQDTADRNRRERSSQDNIVGSSSSKSGKNNRPKSADEKEKGVFKTSEADASQNDKGNEGLKESKLGLLGGTDKDSPGMSGLSGVQTGVDKAADRQNRRNRFGGDGSESLMSDSVKPIDTLDDNSSRFKNLMGNSRNDTNSGKEQDHGQVSEPLTRETLGKMSLDSSSTANSTSGTLGNQLGDASSLDSQSNGKNNNSSEKGDSTSKSKEHGKNVRVLGAGYIARASSPTGSEWGDPTHARMYLSNTVASSRVGSSLDGSLLNDKDSLGKTKSESDLQLHVPTKPQPKMSADDLIWGPMLTRAFTFTYYHDNNKKKEAMSSPSSQKNKKKKSTKKRK